MGTSDREPGWYRLPGEPQPRYWDGFKWTDRRWTISLVPRARRTPSKPGWYYDPKGRYAHQAYWDGEKWTGETRRPIISWASFDLRMLVMIALLIPLGLVMVQCLRLAGS